MKVKVFHTIQMIETIEVDDKFQPLETWDGYSEPLSNYDLADEFMDIMYDKFGEIDYVESENGECLYVN